MGHWVSFSDNSHVIQMMVLIDVLVPLYKLISSKKEKQDFAKYIPSIDKIVQEHKDCTDLLQAQNNKEVEI